MTNVRGGATRARVCVFRRLRPLAIRTEQRRTLSLRGTETCCAMALIRSVRAASSPRASRSRTAASIRPTRSFSCGRCSSPKVRRNARRRHGGEVPSAQSASLSARSDTDDVGPLASRLAHRDRRRRRRRLGGRGRRLVGASARRAHHHHAANTRLRRTSIDSLCGHKEYIQTYIQRLQ